MRKLPQLIIACLVLICAGLVGYNLIYEKPVDPAKFLPRKVLFYFQHKDLEIIINSPYFQKMNSHLSEIDIIQLSLDLGISVETVQKMIKVKEFFTSDTFNIIYKELLSENFTIAVLPNEKKEEQHLDLLDNVVIFCDPEKNVKLLEIAAKTFGKKIQLNTNQYGQHYIHTFNIDNSVKLSAVAVDSQILLSFNRRTLRGCLDIFDEKKPNLTENKKFTEISSGKPGNQLITYIALDGLQKESRKPFNPYPVVRHYIDTFFKEFEGVNSVGYSAKMKEGVIHDNFQVNYDETQLQPTLRNLLTFEPDQNEKLQIIPDKLLLYYWFNTFDLQKIIQIYFEEADIPAKERQELQENIKEVTGCSLQEISNIVNHNFHLIVKKPSASDFVPIPTFSILMETMEPEKIDTFLTKTLEYQEVPYGTSAFRNVKFKYWGEFEQKGVQPCYTLLDDMLVIASSIDMLEKMINAFNGDSTLVKNEFEPIDIDYLSGENNSIGYIHVVEMIDVLKEMVSWGSTMIAIKNEDISKKSKIVTKDLIIPLLNSLSIYSKVLTRSSFQEGNFKMETRTTLSK